MLLRLLLGRAGSGKTTRCFKEMEKELGRGQDGPALIYLVPEQAAFRSEYALATLPGLDGSMRAQVLSFRRLAWRVLQETGGGRRLFIDDMGKGMVLRRVLERQRASLSIYRHAGEKPGLIGELVRLYNELRRAGISVYQLKEYHFRLIGGTGRGGLLGDKLQEIITLLEEAEKELSAHYIDAEDYLLMLALKLKDSAFTRGARLWVDGFHGFTNLELLALQSLCRQAERMTITLCLGRDYPPQEIMDELDPFYNPAVTCQQLQQVAAAGGLTVEKILLPDSPAGPPRFKDSPALAHLERHLHDFPTVPFPPDQRPLPLRLVAASGRQSEVEAVAREIIALARDENYRFREIAVLAHNLEQYADLIIPVFQSCGIPFFLDQKRAILHHPLVEFIRSALEIVNNNWLPDAVFRCIKSGFLFPITPDKEEQIYWHDWAARLENYVLACGIKGTRWRSEETWPYAYNDVLPDTEEKPLPAETAFLEQIDKIRRYLSKPLIDFQDKFRSSDLLKDRVIALYELLQATSVTEHLDLAAKGAREGGEPEKSREQGQIFQGIIHLLDQLVEINGQEKVSALLFARLIDAGLSALRLGLVPPALDQVLVGNLERTRVDNVRALFLLGVNDGILPSRPRGGAIFSESERAILEGEGFPLSPGPRRCLLDEEFLIYLALTRPRHRLWISHPLADEEGKALMPSLLVARLRSLFPDLQEEAAAAEPAETDITIPVEPGPPCTTPAGLPFVFHPRRTLAYLVEQLGSWKRGAQLHPLWWEVYNWYAVTGGERETASYLLGGLFYRNTERPLTPRASGELYGQNLQVSASRLEQFSRCPFAHFAAYGLRLQERRQYSLEAPDIGYFFHTALRNTARTLLGQGRSWGDSSDEELRALVSQEVAGLLPRLQREILLSSRRYKYLAKKMEETVGRTVLSLAKQDRCSMFKPLAVEIAFGRGKELPPLSLPLPDNSTVEVVGRIDRLDLARSAEGDIYLRIIDYKSGPRDVSLVEVFHGLSLQLFLYLDAALTHSPRWLGKAAIPAGIFYFRVYNPLINSSGPLPPEMIEAEIQKRFKLKGKVLAEPAVVKMMDTALQSGYSAIIPAALNKQGEPYYVTSSKSLITTAEFALLCSHVRHLVVKTTMDITAGHLEISPFRLGKNKACQYCPYKAVCQFDLLWEENRFRLLRDIPEDEICRWLADLKMDS